MRDWIKAGEITAQARSYGAKLIKPKKSHKEITEKIESRIIELGGELAFPVQMSVNTTAAHFTSLLNSDFNFKEGDLVKLDLGVHINGAIGDTAITVDLGENSKLVKASKNALNAALEIIKPNIELREIGQVIQDEITSLGFSPIKNLGGHGLERYEIHSNPSIPNYNNGDKTKLKRGQIVAIEPFASSGDGLVIEGNPSEIFQFSREKNIRNPSGRQIIKFIEKNYKTLPFAKRHLLNRFNKLQISTGLLALKREKIFYEYFTLTERRKNSMVSQAEHTVIVGDQITTK